MESDELKELQNIFASSVDVQDPMSIRRWFEEYPELTVREQMAIAGRSLSTIRRWRQKCQVKRVLYAEFDDGIAIHKYITPDFRLPKKPLPDIEIPKDWGPEWIAEQYQNGLNKRQLSALLGCSRSTITRAIRRAEDKVIPPEIIDLINEL